MDYNYNMDNGDLTLEKARKILGKKADKMKDGEILQLMRTADVLAENFLDIYEKSVFNGKTLRELLNKTNT